MPWWHGVKRRDEAKPPHAEGVKGATRRKRQRVRRAGHIHRAQTAVRAAHRPAAGKKCDEKSGRWGCRRAPRQRSGVHARQHRQLVSSDRLTPRRALHGPGSPSRSPSPTPPPPIRHRPCGPARRPRCTPQHPPASQKRHAKKAAMPAVVGTRGRPQAQSAPSPSALTWSLPHLPDSPADAGALPTRRCCFLGAAFELLSAPQLHRLHATASSFIYQTAVTRHRRATLRERRDRNRAKGRAGAQGRSGANTSRSCRPPPPRLSPPSSVTPFGTPKRRRGKHLRKNTKASRERQQRTTRWPEPYARGARATSAHTHKHRHRRETAHNCTPAIHAEIRHARQPHAQQ